MFSNNFLEFDINDFTGSNNNGYCDDNLGLDGFNWSGAGPSQPYFGVDVQGDLNDYPNFPTPSTAPTSLYPTNETFSNEGYNSPFYQGAAMASFSPQQATTTLPPSIQLPFPSSSPIPTLSRGSLSLSPETYAAPITPTHHSYAQPQVIPNPDDLGFDFSTASESFSLPAVHFSPSCDPAYEEQLWRQCGQYGPSYLDAPPSDPVIGVNPPGISLAAPTPSSSGPKRTRQPTREGRRRYDPVKSAGKKVDSKNDWNQTLVRFQVQLDTLYNVQNGQPSGWLVPEMALAEVNTLVKEDLKRSPLRDTKAGEGKRSRDVEDYLRGLLKVIRPIPAGAGSDENGTTVAALSRLADELETQLAVVNQRPVLRQSVNTSKPGQRMSMGGEQAGKRGKKNGSEKARRNCERDHLERISRLFKAPQQQWAKKDILGLAVLFLLYGPDAFPRDFVEVRPIVPGL